MSISLTVGTLVLAGIFAAGLTLFAEPEPITVYDHVVPAAKGGHYADLVRLNARF